MHAYGVTHRDLKPQNVLLGSQGPQLIDFGIARGVEQTALTQDGQAPGTPGFTASEVLTRNEVGAAAAVSYRAVHEEIDTDGVEPGLAALIPLEPLAGCRRRRDSRRHRRVAAPRQRGRRQRRRGRPGPARAAARRRPR
ncbi:protein kinase [Streptomyces niveus]|uniref:protein kinase domain-containing protein n=1 Tax=Streptomyces niveus TaxID=193462 RepID=UPI0036875049